MQRQVRLVVLTAALAAGLAGCERRSDATSREPTTTAPGAAPGSPFRLEVTAPRDCRVGERCAASVRVLAQGTFKLNREFPFKLEPAGELAFPLEAHFSFDEKQRGTLALGFRPTVAGLVRAGGTLHLSVCNDDSCLIEEVPVSVEATVR